MREINKNMAWLKKYHSVEPKLGLERVEALLELVDRPHLKRPVIHIGGTNGKGSTVSYVSHILQEMGFRVGVFSSPYISSYEEQFLLNQRPIKSQVLMEYIEKYQDIFAKAPKDSLIHGITEFELITVLAYDYFANEQVDYVIMEVGMGGLLDSTNVCQPILTGITTIGLDHVSILGNSLEEIAHQKAGIIKNKAPVVTGNIDDGPLKVIKAKAQEEESPLYALGKDYGFTYRGRENALEKFSYWSAYREEDFSTPLLGSHQVENAAMALCLIETLFKGCPGKVDRKALERGLGKTFWPARMESLNRDPWIVLDGAHNPHAIKRLVENAKELFKNREVDILFACISTKDIGQMLKQVHGIGPATFTLTNFEHERAYTNEELMALKGQGDDFCPNWKEYIDRYLEKDKKDRVLLIAGSLYFASHIRGYILEKINRKEE